MEKLGAAVFGNKGELQALEQIVHPAVRNARENFLRQHRARPMVVLDIPLLFEKGVPQGLAGVIVVSAPAWKQRQRVLRRPGMTPRSEEHTSELQSLMRISYAVFCLKKKKKKTIIIHTHNLDSQLTHK